MTNSFKAKLQTRIATAQAKAQEAQEVAMEKLLENEAFIESQRSMQAKEEELTELGTIMIQLNAIAPFIANDGRKFSVNVFPVASFGTGLGSVIGIVQGSRSAFVDEKLLEFSAITGVSIMELQEAQMALGSPAYYKDGKLHEPVSGDYYRLAAILESIFLKLGLNEFKASEVTQDKYDLWFAVSEAKAIRQLNEHDTLQDLEKDATDFVLE